jgi:hypothetical protein
VSPLVAHSITEWFRTKTTHIDLAALKPALPRQVIEFATAEFSSSVEIQLRLRENQGPTSPPHPCPLMRGKSRRFICFTVAGAFDSATPNVDLLSVWLHDVSDSLLAKFRRPAGIVYPTWLSASIRTRETRQSTARSFRLTKSRKAWDSRVTSAAGNICCDSRGPRKFHTAGVSPYTTTRRGPDSSKQFTGATVNTA